MSFKNALLGGTSNWIMSKVIFHILNTVFPFLNGPKIWSKKFGPIKFFDSIYFITLKNLLDHFIGPNFFDQFYPYTEIFRGKELLWVTIYSKLAF